METLAGGWGAAGKYSAAVFGTSPQLKNGTAARGGLSTGWQWRGASQNPCRMIMRRVVAEVADV